MSCLIDTNVFLRLVPRTDPDRQTILIALNRLRAGGEDLCYTTQVLAEFWTVCTRPATSRGGYGLSIDETDKKVRMIERYCRFLPETSEVHREWRRLVLESSVSGVAVHDARLAAAAIAFGMTRILTVNIKDFIRFQSSIQVVTPDQI